MKKFNTVRFLHRCRKCKAVFSMTSMKVTRGNISSAAQELINAQHGKTPLGMTANHHCSKHEMGIADLIGFEPNYL